MNEILIALEFLLPLRFKYHLIRYNVLNTFIYIYIYIYIYINMHTLSRKLFKNQNRRSEKKNIYKTLHTHKYSGRKALTTTSNLII